MLINGCKNDVKLSYTAIPLAKKLNLLDILCKSVYHMKNIQA